MTKIKYFDKKYIDSIYKNYQRFLFLFSDWLQNLDDTTTIYFEQNESVIKSIAPERLFRPENNQTLWEKATERANDEFLFTTWLDKLKQVTRIPKILNHISEALSTINQMKKEHTKLGFSDQQSKLAIKSALSGFCPSKSEMFWCQECKKCNPVLENCQYFTHFSMWDNLNNIIEIISIFLLQFDME